MLFRSNGIIGEIAGWYGGAGAKAPVNFKVHYPENMTYNIVRTTVRHMDPSEVAIKKAMKVGAFKAVKVAAGLFIWGDDLQNMVEKKEKDIYDFLFSSKCPE